MIENEISVGNKWLQTLFNHASPTITKRYLGITDSELESSYDLLDF